jgi:hypothetical protein
MIVTVERITEGIAVLELESRERIEIPAKKLPPSAKEGDCLDMSETGELSPNAEETAKRRKRNADLFKRLTGK